MNSRLSDLFYWLMFFGIPAPTPYHRVIDICLDKTKRKEKTNLVLLNHLCFCIHILKCLSNKKSCLGFN